MKGKVQITRCGPKCAAARQRLSHHMEAALSQAHRSSQSVSPVRISLSMRSKASRQMAIVHCILRAVTSMNLKHWLSFRRHQQLSRYMESWTAATKSHFSAGWTQGLGSVFKTHSKREALSSKIMAMRKWKVCTVVKFRNA